MGQNLGSLVVRLGLDASEFTSGMTKSEAQAQKFSKQLGEGMASAARLAGIAIAGVGVAAGAAFVILKREVESVAVFKQLSEQIGDTAAAVAGLKSVSSTSGVAMDEIAAASIKLTASLSKTDDESKGAANALKQIGINLEDFQKLSPVAQLESIAKALAKFEDGAGKTAFAVAAFGKAGAQAIPFLNDLADAGDRQIKLTQEQIEAADRYVKQQARMRAEIEQVIQLVAVESLHAFTSFTGALKDTALAIIGVDSESKKLTGNNISDWAKSVAEGLGFIVDAGDGVVRTFQIAGRAIGSFVAAREALSKGEFGQAKNIFLDYAKDLDAILMRPLFSDRLAARLAAAPPAKTPARPQLDPKRFAIASGDSKTGADEYARALEAIAKMAAGATFELTNLLAGEENVTHAQKALALLMADKVWETFNQTQRDTLTTKYNAVAATERLIEAEKKAREEHEKNIKSLQDAAEAETRARDKVRESVTAYTEHNDVLVRELAILGQGDVAHQKLAAAIEHEKLVREANNAGALTSIADLDKEYQKRLQLIEAFDVANKKLEEQKKTKEFIDSLGDAFGHAAEDAIVFGKYAKDVLKGLEQDLLRLITRRLVTQPLSNAISGFITSAFGSMLGGAGAATVPYTAAALTMGPAAPIPGFASGTDFAPGGRAKIGEFGPEEMFVPRGARIISNHELEARREAKSSTINYNTTINAPAGVDRRSARQVSREYIRTMQESGIAGR